MDEASLLQLENIFRNESFETDETFTFVQGDIPIIISAPHSVKHFREGKEKVGEFMTGALAIALNKSTGCSIIYKTKNDFTDPNYDQKHDYKTELIDLIDKYQIKMLIDLHIMSDTREPDIEIGTGTLKNINFDKNLLSIFTSIFQKANIQKVIVDKFFTAGNPNTVSSSIHAATKIPCVQIEINWRLLSLDSKDNKVTTVIQVLESICQELLSYLKEK